MLTCWNSLTGKSIKTDAPEVEECRQIGKTVLIIESCVQFFERLASDMRACLNAACFHEKMPISQRRVVITLILKKRLQSHWRPITQT